MKNINIRIISVTLSAFVLLGTTSCKLQKKQNKYTIMSDTFSLDLNNEKYNNITDNRVKEIIIDLIEKIEEKNYDLPIDNFIDKLSRTTFIKNPDGEFALGTYDDEEHTFTYLPNDDETIRHELLHMLLPSHNNSSIDEGLVQIFLNNLYGYEIDENVFDASLCKIFCKILNPEELKNFILGDTDSLRNKLASIKPAYEDAKDFLVYANNAQYYYRLYNESKFNNTEQEFKEKEEYGWLKSYRKVVRDRIKIYLYSYYDNMDFEQNPYDRLVEIFQIMNLVSYPMNNATLEEVPAKDNFLKTIIDKICITYNIDNETLLMAENEAKEFFSSEDLKKINGNSVKAY